MAMRFRTHRKAPSDIEQDDVTRKRHFQTNGDVHNTHKSNGLPKHKLGQSQDSTFDPDPPTIKLNGVALNTPNGIIKQANGSETQQSNGSVKKLWKSNGESINNLYTEDETNSWNETRKEGKGKALVSGLASPKSSSRKVNGSVTFADDVDIKPDRLEPPEPGTSRSTFREVVRRHFGRDRLFNLVQTLLSTVEEEKAAHQDLINSFQTARKIKVPVYSSDSLQPSTTRPRHGRRRSVILLADKIKQDRQTSRKNSLTDSGDPGDVGESSTVSTETEQHRTEDASEKNRTDKASQELNRTDDASQDSIKTDDRSQELNRTDDTSQNDADEDVNDDVCDTSVNLKHEQSNEGYNDLEDPDKEEEDAIRTHSVKPISEKGKSSKGSIVKLNSSDKEGLHNEECDSVESGFCDKEEQFNNSENEKDKSFLDELPSVLTNNLSEAPAREISRSYETVDEPVVIIEVESSSGSESDDEPDIVDSKATSVYYIDDYNEYSDYTGDCVIELVCSRKAMASSDEEEFYKQVEMEDLGSGESDTDIQYLNEKVACISTVEYENKPKAKLRPTLGSIAEAENSAGSFTEFHYQRGDSPDIFEERGESPDILEERCQSSMATNKCYRDTDTPVYRNKPKTVSRSDDSVNEYRNRPKPADRGDDCYQEYRDNPTPASTPDQTDQQSDGPEFVNGDNDVVYVRKRTKKIHKKTGNKQKAQQSKQISIDLINVYNENEDLQKVDRRNGSQKTRKRTKNVSPRTKMPRTKSVRHAKHKHNTCNVPLPPRDPPRNTRCTRPVSCTSTRSAPDLDRRTEVVEFYRSYQSRKDSSRYERPDSVLWASIGVSGRCKSAVERYAGQREDLDEEGEEEEAEEAERRGSTSLLRRPQEEPNTCKVWDMPITEAVKRVKSAKNVPPPRDLEDSTPRHVRVKQMYAQLKRMRRGTGYTPCKPLISLLTRRPSDFRI